MSAPAIRQAAMRRLWERMVAIYGYRWTSAYGEAAEDGAGALTLAADTWARGLAGIDERAIGSGLDACLASADPWPPTLPAFRAACLSIPTLHAVRAELRKKPNAEGIPSPFLRLVLSGIDTHRLRHASADATDRMVRDAYEAAREHVMRGGALPEPPAALVEAQAEARTPASPETAAAELDRMAAVFVTGDPEPQSEAAA